MTKTISSQHHLDDEIVAAKRAAGDYTVLVSPGFEIEGQRVCVVLDGHHSLAAAKADGAAIDWQVATAQDHDAVSLIDNDPALFLEAVWVDGDYYDAINGGDVW